MDITLIKTFLETVSTGNFASAADRLYVSQSAVSLRIKSLEEHLGRPVFIRRKTGVTLTPAGEQFLRYANTFLQVWEEAKQQVAVPEGYKDVLVIAGEYGLWNRLLVRWLPLMAQNLPDVAFRAEVARPARLVRQMIEGTVDIAVLYSPQVRPGINVKELFEDRLVMISTDKNTKDIDEKYVFVDWGEEFSAFHAGEFPDYRHPRMTFDLGPITINYLLNNGGSGYMPERIADPFIDAGKLHIVKRMPSFGLPVHVAWRDQIKEQMTEKALHCLNEIVVEIEENRIPSLVWA